MPVGGRPCASPTCHREVPGPPFVAKERAGSCVTAIQTQCLQIPEKMRCTVHGAYLNCEGPRPSGHTALVPGASK